MELLKQYGHKVLFWVSLVVSFLVGAPIAFGVNEVTTTTLSSDEATEFISEQALRIALYQLAAYQFAEKHTLKAHSGRNFQMVRYEHLTLPQNQLTQGTTPSNTAMTIHTVNAVAEQWGAVITMYDVPMLTIAHPVLEKAVELLGVQAAKVIERECQRAMMASTNTQFANAKATRTLLATTDYLTSLEVRKAVTNLKKGGAAPWKQTKGNTTKGYLERMVKSGGGTQAAKSGMGAASGLIGIVDTDVSQDLQSDSTFVNASSYSNIRALHNGEIGKWLGVVWIESNFMPAITLLTSPAIATENHTGFAGGYTAATAYDFKVTRVNESYGLEEAVSAKIDATTGGADDSFTVVLPTAAGYRFKVYAGADAGTLYEVQTASTTAATTADDLTGPTFDDGQTIRITSLPTSGNVAPTEPATGVTVHVTWIFGLEAFGCVELQKLQAYLTEDKATKDDPLNQKRLAGWKAMFKAVIQNNAFLRMVESASAFAG